MQITMTRSIHGERLISVHPDAWIAIQPDISVKHQIQNHMTQACAIKQPDGTFNKFALSDDFEGAIAAFLELGLETSKDEPNPKSWDWFQEQGYSVVLVELTEATFICTGDASLIVGPQGAVPLVEDVA